jgi:DNA-binding NtrC family response regulator
MKSVVIIDDQEEMTTLLKRFFEKFGGLRITTFNDSQRGLHHITTTQIDLVVSDITMPKLDGIELLRQIKDVKPEINVIMITAEASLERVLKSHRYDALDFIQKPINLYELEKRVKQILEL